MKDLIDKRLVQFREFRDQNLVLLTESEQEQISKVLAKISARSEAGLDITTVAFLGGSGVGKSSLINAIVEEDLCETGLHRPTTVKPMAIISGESEANSLLDWIGIEKRKVTESKYPTADTVLIDMPDVDSFDDSQREETIRLAEFIDAFVWVLDPQKYADALIHREFLRNLQLRNAVVIVALSQIDTVPSEQREVLLTDVQRLISEDGMQWRVLVTSAVTRRGVPELRSAIVNIVEQELPVKQEYADIESLKTTIMQSVGSIDQIPEDIKPTEMPPVADDILRISGLSVVVSAIPSSYEYNSTVNCAPAPISLFVKLFREDPLPYLISQSNELSQSAVLKQSDVPVDGHKAKHASKLALDETNGRNTLGKILQAVIRKKSTGLTNRWATDFSNQEDRVCGQTETAIEDLLSRTDSLGYAVPAFWKKARIFQWGITLPMFLLGLFLFGLRISGKFSGYTVLGSWLLPISFLFIAIVISLVVWTIGVIDASRKAGKTAVSANNELNAKLSEVLEKQLAQPLNVRLADYRTLIEKVDTL